MAAELWGGESLVRASTPTGAVFLCYASQDAGAAQRVCEALRAAVRRYGQPYLFFLGTVKFEGCVALLPRAKMRGGGRKRIESLRKRSGAERAILGFLIAPLVPAFLLTLPAALQHNGVAFAQLLTLAKVSYCATLLIAVPAHFLLRKRRWTFLSIYVLVGGAMGLVVYLFHLMLGVPFYVPGLGPVARTLISLPVDTVGGVIILICFWLIARPDRE